MPIPIINVLFGPQTPALQALKPLFLLSAAQNTAHPLIAADMEAVDRVIIERLNSGVALVGTVSQYIISAGGKRIRPALLLMMAGALGYKGTQHHNLAAVVEFIHLSLIHI